MASKVEIQLNSAGVRALHRDPGVLSDVGARARRMAVAAGDGFEASSMTGKRARASVITVTREARKAEASGRALTRAIDAGR
jgi:hypothetical protein